MSVLSLSSPNVPTFINEKNEFATIETDIDFNFEGESCAFFEEGISAVYKGGSVFPEVNEDVFGFVQKSERQLSPQAIWDVDAFIESNSTKLRNNLKRPQTASPATIEMPSLKRSVPSFDAYIDVSISQEAMQRCVADYFNKRSGITFEFCPNMRTWSVLIFHGAQMCALSFKMSPAGTATEQQIRFSGRLENGSNSLETLHSIINTLKSRFEQEQRNNQNNNINNHNSNIINARKPHSVDYALPSNQRILDMMVALAADKGNLTRQQEAVQCLSEMALDAALLPVMHARGATQALLDAYADCALEAPPVDAVLRAAHFAALFSESAAVSHAKHEIAMFALAALASFSALPEAMTAISAAPVAWTKLCALHQSFSASERSPGSELTVVSVPCLEASIDRLRRRAMHRLSSAIQDAYEQSQPFVGSPLVRSFTFTAEPASTGGSVVVGDGLVREVADMRV